MQDLESDLLLPGLPTTGNADPQGQGDETNVEPEGPPANIEQIVAELPPALHVLGQIQGGQAGEAGANAHPPPELRQAVPNGGIPVVVMDHLPECERPRTDKAHLPLHDVQDLVQL